MTNPNNNNNDQLRHWDVITATVDGGVVWRRYGDGLIVVTMGEETPEGAGPQRASATPQPLRNTAPSRSPRNHFTSNVPSGTLPSPPEKQPRTSAETA